MGAASLLIAVAGAYCGITFASGGMVTWAPIVLAPGLSIIVAFYHDGDNVTTRTWLLAMRLLSIFAFLFVVGCAVAEMGFIRFHYDHPRGIPRF